MDYRLNLEELTAFLNCSGNIIISMILSDDVDKTIDENMPEEVQAIILYIIATCALGLSVLTEGMVTDAMLDEEAQYLLAIYKARKFFSTRDVDLNNLVDMVYRGVPNHIRGTYELWIRMVSGYKEYAAKVKEDMDQINKARVMYQHRTLRDIYIGVSSKDGL